MYSNSPIVSIKKFDFADSVRPGKRRLPGECVVLRNTAPSLSGGERVRRGYKSYTNVVAPTGTEILKVVPIQSPSQEDVHLWFSTSGIYMNPWWDSSGTKQTTNLFLRERKTISAVTTVSGSTITLKLSLNTATNDFALSGTTDYYKNWKIKNTTQGEYALIKSYTVSGDDATITTVEVLTGGSSLGWLNSDSYIIYRNAHADESFGPTYNNDLTNPPVANAQNSIIRFSGGQSSTATNNGVWVAPLLDRTFFPSDNTYKFRFLGTYASPRQCSALSTSDLITRIASTPATGTALTSNKTYWLAFAPVYDGFQIGQLARFDTYTQYSGTLGGTGGWTFNQFTTGTDTALVIDLKVSLAKLDKRITGFRIYMAQDVTQFGQIRQSQYFFIKSVPITTTDGLGGSWAFVPTDGKFEITSIKIDGDVWNARGNTYVQDSGYVEIPSDTMYAYSDEVLVGESRRYLSNCYVTSEGKVDREKLFINPVGGAADLNAGLVEPDIFSNEDGIYRKAPEPTIGTKIQAMKAIGLEDLLIIRDRGLLVGRQIVDEAGFPDFLWSIISYEVGCTTIQQAVQANDGWIYFAGYDDIYRYRGAFYESLIRKGDSNDWLNTYREVITKAQKESTVTWYLPDGVIYFDISQATGFQFAYYPPKDDVTKAFAETTRLVNSFYTPQDPTKTGGWRQVNFKQTSGIASTQFFKWMTRLQNGTILGTTNDSPAQFMQFSDPTDLKVYYNDDGTAIKAQIDTGDFLLGGDEAIDARWDKLAIDKTTDVPTTGSLDVSVWKDTVLLKTVSGLDTTDTRPIIQSRTDEPRIGQLWRMAYNVNTSTPEVMQSSGKVLQINSIDWFADKLPYLRRASVIPLTGGETCLQTLGTVGGVREVTYTTANQDQSYVFDVPFTATYSSLDGTTEPKYGIVFVRARTSLGQDVGTTEITLIQKTLTGFTINGPRGNVLVEFAIV